jgi:hypothetical protein
MTEFAKAYAIALRVAEQLGADPDADMAILARQLLRLTDRAIRHLLLLRNGHGDRSSQLRDAWFYELVQAIDPEGFAEGRYGGPSP